MTTACNIACALVFPRLGWPWSEPIRHDKQALLDAIVMPSAAISFGYESWVIETKNQGMIIGLLAEDTAQRVTVKTDATEQVRLKPSDIVSRRQSRFSMMPEGLINVLTPQQIVDLLEFLTTLKAHPTTALR